MIYLIGNQYEAEAWTRSRFPHLLDVAPQMIRRISNPETLHTIHSGMVVVLLHWDHAYSYTEQDQIRNFLGSKVEAWPEHFSLVVERHNPVRCISDWPKDRDNE